MIRILQNWEEVGEAFIGLQKSALPLHQTPQKNWDHSLLNAIFSRLPRGARIIDLGCGSGDTLLFLEAMGFRDLHGIDLKISARLWLRETREILRRRAMRLPFHLHRGNLTSSGFPDAAFDAAVSVSTIEHGIDTHAFLAEAWRLLKPGGILFLTTDYWETGASLAHSLPAYGLPWQVFDRGGVERLIAGAFATGFAPLENGEVPPCGQKTVLWNSAEYTFMAIALRKVEAGAATAGWAETNHA